MTEQSLFDTCWQALRDGESLEAISQRYPDQSRELGPMLAAAGQLQSLRSVSTPPAFRQSTRARLLEEISSVPQAENTSVGQRFSIWWNELWATGARPFAKPVWAGATLGLLLAVVLLSSTTYASQAAIPGDSLYPLKLISEQLWLRVPANSPDLNLTLAERRLHEARLLQTLEQYERIPDAMANYRMLLYEWSEQADSVGLQNQNRIQQRLREQLLTLQVMSESAAPEHQSMLQEQQRTTERLMHRFGPSPIPTPERQPIGTTGPAQKKNQNRDGKATPDEHQATPVPPTKTPSHTPTETAAATATSDAVDDMPPGHTQGQSNQGTPNAIRTPHQPSKPDRGTGPPTNSPPKQAPASPTLKVSPILGASPTPANTPTARPGANPTPGDGGQGTGTQPTQAPGHDGRHSGSGSQPTTSPGKGDRGGG